MRKMWIPKKKMHKYLFCDKGDDSMQNITVEQIRDYTALAVRHSELVSASGSRWRPEYAAELEKITKELSDMKKEMFREEKV